MSEMEKYQRLTIDSLDLVARQNRPERVPRQLSSLLETMQVDKHRESGKRRAKVSISFHHITLSLV
jgi:hypothetical protein